jgi:hypothetical protein
MLKPGLLEWQLLRRARHPAGSRQSTTAAGAGLSHSLLVRTLAAVALTALSLYLFKRLR